jgi:thiol-disulfide isomerase/thioredoxin
MKPVNYKYLFIFICCVSLLRCAKPSPKEKERTTEKSTSLYTDLDGNAVSLADFKGKRILLNFWATWCTPCLKEMPSLAKAQEILKDENYVFLFPTTDKLQKVTQFQKNSKHPFRFLLVTTSLDKLQIYALPATFIYDTNGKMAKRIDGATEWDSEEILNQLRAIK